MKKNVHHNFVKHGGGSLTAAVLMSINKEVRAGHHDYAGAYTELAEMIIVRCVDTELNMCAEDGVEDLAEIERRSRVRVQSFMDRAFKWSWEHCLEQITQQSGSKQ